MTTLNPENVRFVAERLRELQAQDAVEYPDGEPAPADTLAEADAGAEGPAGVELETELRAAVADLEPDQQCDLVALMWLGRGDFELDDWSAALAEAREALEEPVAEHLLATPLAAEYLEEGLNQHGHALA